MNNEIEVFSFGMSFMAFLTFIVITFCDNALSGTITFSLGYTLLHFAGLVMYGEGVAV